MDESERPKKSNNPMNGWQILNAISLMVFTEFNGPPM